MTSWFSHIRNKPPHARQKIVFGIAFSITICIFLVWGISKFRILSHRVEESRSENITKPSSPFAVFGKSLKNIFNDMNISQEENFIINAPIDDIQLEDTFDSSQMYFEEDFALPDYFPAESLETPKDTINLYD